MSNWIGIDSCEWEQVDFTTMEWRYVQDKDDIDHRYIKRVSATEWLITDDYDCWRNYTEEVNEEEGKVMTEGIETHYQDWLKNNG